MQEHSSLGPRAMTRAMMRRKTKLEMEKGKVYFYVFLTEANATLVIFDLILQGGLNYGPYSVGSAVAIVRPTQQCLRICVTAVLDLLVLENEQICF
jgi:hypothetical protein